MRLLPLIALVGCGEPVSNALFYADADFAVALPGDDRLALPLDLVTGDAVASDLHAAALEQLDLLDQALAPLQTTGQTVRTTRPTTRSDQYRGWDAVPIVGRDGSTWWARAAVSHDGSPAAYWTLDIGTRADGPFVQLAEGRHDGESGSMVYGVERETEQVIVEYGLDANERFTLDITHPGGRLGRDALTWTVTEARKLRWEGELPLASGLSVPGIAEATASAAGGRVDALTDDGIELTSCWDAAGDEQWAMEGGVTLRGDRLACQVEGPE